jgi:hypothetical protein
MNIRLNIVVETEIKNSRYYDTQQDTLHEDISISFNFNSQFKFKVSNSSLFTLFFFSSGKHVRFNHRLN